METLDTASPTVIYDVHAESWAYLVADKDRYTHLLTWVREQGLDPEEIYRIEVYSASALIFEHKRNEQGHRYCDIEHDHAAQMRACRSAKREPYSVILTSTPPS